jgi:cyclohexanone monooxygenase
MDGWTDIARRIREKILALPLEDRSLANMLAAYEDSDAEKMEEIRARVDAIVEDPDTASGLKAWYRQLCKRPCFHEEYLQAYNEPGVTLVHTDGKGVERITETGVVVAGTEYELDCLVFASGFEVGTSYTDRAGYDATGRDGLTLSDYWADGMRTRHGIHVHGFPNLFMVQLTHAANLISNVPHNFTEAARAIAATVDHAVRGAHDQVEVTKAGEDEWMELLHGAGGMGIAGIIGSSECTPGYYNNEGQPGGLGSELLLAYPGGPVAYFQYLKKWCATGDFDGLEFR